MTPTTAYEITCGKCGVITTSTCPEAYMGEQLCPDCGKIAAEQIAAWESRWRGLTIPSPEVEAWEARVKELAERPASQ